MECQHYMQVSIPGIDLALIISTISLRFIQVNNPTRGGHGGFEPLTFIGVETGP